jgi:hypothetical protein
MRGYVTVGADNIDSAEIFYSAFLPALGFKLETAPWSHFRRLVKAKYANSEVSLKGGLEQTLTCLSADPFGPVLVLISYPFTDYDEPKTLVKQNCRSVSKAMTGYKLPDKWRLSSYSRTFPRSDTLR